MRSWLPLTRRRVAAYGVDILLLAVVLVPFSFVIYAVTGGEVASGTDVWRRLLLTVSLPAWAYFIASDWWWHGRSLGKRVLGLRTVAGDGRVGLTAAVTRTALKLLPWELIHLAFFGLAGQLGEVTPLQGGVAASAYAVLAAYLLVLALNSGQRSIPDLVAGTSVIRNA